MTDPVEFDADDPAFMFNRKDLETHAPITFSPPRIYWSRTSGHHLDVVCAALSAGIPWTGRLPTLHDPAGVCGAVGCDSTPGRTP